MSQDPEPTSTPVFDPAIQTEKIAFDADQLIACGGCGRMNAPNRLKCLYCAHDLEPVVSPALSTAGLRKLEPWERGHNVVLLEISEGGDLSVAAGIANAPVETLAETALPVPLARVESEREAALLIDSLDKAGLRCISVEDAGLAPDRLPVRLRHIGFADGDILLTDFNTNEVTRVAASDLTIAVPGRLFEGRVDTSEKRGRKGKSKVLDETATGSDELVLDIYRRGDTTGYRINQAGFDFSSLGPEKSLLVAENMRRLTDRLREAAPHMTIVDDYAGARPVLDLVWEPEVRKDPQGVRRTGHRLEFGTVSTTSNLNQFTRYSRLRQLLYEAKTS